MTAEAEVTKTEDRFAFKFAFRGSCHSCPALIFFNEYKLEKYNSGSDFDGALINEEVYLFSLCRIYCHPTPTRIVSFILRFIPDKLKRMRCKKNPLGTRRI